MIITETNDAWQEALLQGSIIQGHHLKHAKGKFYVDDVEVAIGPSGLKVCVLMPTALTGRVLYENGEFVDKRLHRYADAPRPDDIPKGWNPYTAFLCVGVDEEHRGELMTYDSYAWSSRYAFKDLIFAYVRRGKRLLPVVTFNTKAKRRDPNGNIDPVFVPVDWANPSDFAGYLPDEVEQPRRLQQAAASVASLRAPEIEHDRAPAIDEDPNAGLEPIDF